MIHRRAFLLSPLALLAAGRKPNVVLIIAPGWRGVATPWVADPDINAPNLTKFAENAIVFPRAYACDPGAEAARGGILTGIYPHAPLAARTLPDLLKSAGYRILSDASAVKKDLDGRFFLHVTLDAPGFVKPFDPETFHLRPNVPPDREEETRVELAERYAVYAALDRQFGEILAALPQESIVVFTSDRGEQIGSHSLDGDGVPYEESVRIPLAIRSPALRPDASDLLVSQVDIVPTIFGLCGEPPPEGVQGHDLSPLLTGAQAGAQGERPESILVEGNLGKRDEWRMLILGTDKLVVDAEGAVSHLYNLAADPYELKNLAQDPASKLKRDSLLANLRAARSRLLDFRRRP